MLRMLNLVVVAFWSTGALSSALRADDADSPKIIASAQDSLFEARIGPVHLNSVGGAVIRNTRGARTLGRHARGRHARADGTLRKDFAAAARDNCCSTAQVNSAWQVPRKQMLRLFQHVLRRHVPPINHDKPASKSSAPE